MPSLPWEWLAPAPTMLGNFLHDSHEYSFIMKAKATYYYQHNVLYLTLADKQWPKKILGITHLSTGTTFCIFFSSDPKELKLTQCS
jgi:hypothetical protein